MRILLGLVGAAVLAFSPASIHRIRPLAHAYPGGGYTGDVYVHRGFAYLSSWHGNDCPAQGVRVYDLGRPALAARNYAEMAMIGPRLWVASVARPGRIARGAYNFMSDSGDMEDTQGTLAPNWGYSQLRNGDAHAGFVKAALPDPPLRAIILRPGAPLSHEVELTDAPLTGLQAAYLPAIKALCDKNGAMLVMLKQPMAEHQDPNVIEVSRQVLALGIPIIATSRRRMFGEVSDRQVRQNYFNYFHLNSNGARRAAQAYAPAFEELLR